MRCGVSWLSIHRTGRSTGGKDSVLAQGLKKLPFFSFLEGTRINFANDMFSGC